MALHNHAPSSGQIFTLAGHGLSLNTAEDLAPHIANLIASPDIREVHLGGNTLGVRACEALARVLSTKKSLKIADFADIFTGRLITEIPIALKALCDALLEVPALEELDLSDNAFGGRSVEPMVALLSQHPNLSTLKLSNNGLGPSGGTVIAHALKSLANKARDEHRISNLRRVICGRNRLENGSASAWAEAFAAHGTLIEVRMYQNGIRMEGITALAQGLTACKNLRILDLQDNTAIEAGSRALAQALPSWPELRTLNLSDCLLKSRGSLAIANALDKGFNPNLEELLLQSNEVDAKTVEVLALAVSHHLPHLSKIELNGNRVDAEEQCVKDLIEALEAQGHKSALDEIDDVEEADSEEDEEEAASEQEAEEEILSARTVVSQGTPAEDVTAAESPLVQRDAKVENFTEPKPDQDVQVDDLSKFLAKTTL